MVRRFAYPLIFLASGCANSPPMDKSGELVVWGTLKNRSFEALDEWGLNGSAAADLHITHVDSGRAPSRILKIRYIAHSYIKEGVEMRFRLQRSETGEYLVCTEGGRGYICS